MKIIALLTAAALAACASPSPNISTDTIRDGTVVCATVMGPWGSGKTVVAKLDERVIRDGGGVTVDANCTMNVQLLAPAPKTVAPKPAP